MSIIFFILYLMGGAKANSFCKHRIFHMQTVYVFSWQQFILDKICWAALLGWISIPIAIGMKVFGTGKQI